MRQLLHKSPKWHRISNKCGKILQKPFRLIWSRLTSKQQPRRGLGLPVQAWASQLRQSACWRKNKNIKIRKKWWWKRVILLENDDFPIHLTENNGLGERRWDLSLCLGINLIVTTLKYIGCKPFTDWGRMKCVPELNGRTESSLYPLTPLQSLRWDGIFRCRLSKVEPRYFSSLHIFARAFFITKNVY